MKGPGLKHVKVGSTFSSFNSTPAKTTESKGSAPGCNLLNSFFISLTENSSIVSNDNSTENSSLR